MIDFQPAKFDKKQQYTQLMQADRVRGCEFSFNNLFLWGDQRMAFHSGCAVVHSSFDGFLLYPYPAGTGDRRSAVEAILADAAERGIPCRLSGLTPDDRAELEQLFPGKFLFQDYRNGYDYVYDINELAELKGRRLQKKRNHVNKFLSMHPDWRTVELTTENLQLAREFAESWYAERLAERPEADYEMEQIALRRAFDHYTELSMEGLLLMEGEQVLAFTFGSLLRPEIFDTNFEKAREHVDGAYAVINREFARFLRSRYPALRYIDREDDMGVEGLRQAKLSYSPHHLVEKGIACLASEGLPDED